MSGQPSPEASAGGGGDTPVAAAAAAVHLTAFTAEPVLQEPRLQCLEVWSSYLLAGLADGTLLLLTKRAVSPGSGASGLQWGVSQTLRGFGRRHILQLEVAKQRSMLLCLADDGLNAFSLPELRLKAQAGRTKGASSFAWDDATSVLAVAAKRRLLLFLYDGLEFAPQRELSLADSVHSMRFAGGTLYVAMAKGDCAAVDFATGTLTPLPGSKGGIPASVASLSPTEVLVTRDAQSTFFGADVRPSRRGKPPSWSLPPLAVAASGPFVVALQEAAAEVRLLEPLSSSEMSQHVELPPGQALLAPTPMADGSLFVASRGGGSGNGSSGGGGVITHLQPVPYQQQAAQLLQQGEHEEALAMCTLMPASEVHARRRLEDQVHLSYGQQLFREGHYEDAMLHLGMSTLAGPLQLLRLVPSLAPPQLLRRAEEVEAAASVDSRDGPTQQQQGSATGGAGSEAEGGGAAAAAAAEPQGETYTAAVSTLLPYLLSHRSRLAAAAAGSSPGRQGSPGPDSTAAEGAGSAGLRPLPPAAVQQRLQSNPAAVLVDTALLRALLALPDSGALLRYVQRPNCVDLEAGEESLQGAGRYSELVALFQSKGRHAAALDLLRTLSQQPEQLSTLPQGASAELRGYPGVWAAVRYICQMQEQDPHLLTTHAKWILAADPEAGLEMFGSMQPPLAPAAALPILTAYAPALAGPYLEGALSSGAADPAVYEQELAMIYLQRVLAAAAAAGGSSPQAHGGGGRGGGALSPAAPPASPPLPQQVPEYSKLKKLILGSSQLDCEALLRLLPPRRLLEVRAALLERLGRHSEALRLYVHRLHQPQMAEAYCDRVYARRQAQRWEARRAAVVGSTRQGRSAAAAAAAAGPPLPGGAGPGGSRRLQFGESSGGGGGAEGPGGAAATAAGPRSGGAMQSLLPALGPGGSTSGDGDFDIYLLLIQVLLEEELDRGGYRPARLAPDDAVWGEVARLLSRKRDALEPLHALGLLPGEVPLANVLPFLEGGLWGAAERRRSSAVMRHLQRAEHLSLLGGLSEAKQRSILLTPERACSLCYKRLGTAAFVVLPGGMLGHYSCYRRSAGQQQVGGGTENGGGSGAGSGSAQYYAY